jgi:hypothetical protein
MTAQDKELVVSYLTLRQMIGWVAILMPIAVRAGAYCFENVHSTNSISAYYYTGMRDVFVSTLVLSGALLACYRTPARSDNVVAVIAGLAAIGIGLFPMDPYYAKEILERFPEVPKITCYKNTGILGYHFYFVGTFFALAFYLVYFRFSAFTPREPTRQKILRNRIYKVCGAGMLVGFVAIGVLAVLHKGASIFWPETLAVVAFSAAWLVKGRIVLKDRPTTVRETATQAP